MATSGRINFRQRGSVFWGTLIPDSGLLTKMFHQRMQSWHSLLLYSSISLCLLHVSREQIKLHCPLLKPTSGSQETIIKLDTAENVQRTTPAGTRSQQA